MSIIFVKIWQLQTSSNVTFSVPTLSIFPLRHCNIYDVSQTVCLFMFNRLKVLNEQYITQYRYTYQQCESKMGIIHYIQRRSTPLLMFCCWLSLKLWKYLPTFIIRTAHGRRAKIKKIICHGNYFMSHNNILLLF